MFKGLANIASLMRQAQQMGSKMQGITELLKTKRATGTAAGGMVLVEVNGLGEVLRLVIDPALSDREMIEDLVPAAVNQAQAKARELHVEAMQSLTSEIDMPGLNEALAEMTGGGESKG